MISLNISHAADHHPASQDHSLGDPGVLQLIKTSLCEAAHANNMIESLFIASNDLEMLPKEVMLFHSSLKVLDASFNAIVDIPVLFCQACTSLCILDLRGNRLTTFPKEIWRLLTLHTLHLGTNLLISIPYGSFSGLSELRTLDLCGNQIELIPADLFLSCPKLEWLDISHNRVSSIPNSIANATYLTHLNLSNNTIKEVPAAFGELHALVSFDISENTLEILAHNVFGYLQNLRILVLHHNRLTHLPSMDDLISLETLDIRYNYIKALPQGLCKLASLESMYLYDSDDDGEDDYFIHCLINSARKRNPSSEDLVELDTFTFTQTPSLLPASPYYLELAKKRSMKHKCNPITYPPQRECKAGLDSIMAYLRQTSATHAAYTDTTCHTFTSHTPSNYMSLTSPSSTNPIIKIDLERQMYADLSQNSNDENTFQPPTLTKALSPPSYSVDSLIAVEYVGALCFQKEYTIANQYLDAWTECRKASLSTPMDLVLCATHLANTVSLYKSLACPPETQLDLSSVAELLQALIRITIRFCRLRLLPLVQPAFLGDLFVALSNSAAVPEVVSANGFNKNPMIHAPDTASKRLIDMMQSLLELLDTNGPRWHAAESMASALCFVVDVAVWNTFIVERTVDVVLCLASLHRGRNAIYAWRCRCPSSAMSPVTVDQCMPWTSMILAVLDLDVSSLILSASLKTDAFTHILSDLSQSILSVTSLLNSRQRARLVTLALGKVSLTPHGRTVIDTVRDYSASGDAGHDGSLLAKLHHAEEFAISELIY
ncbi:hypothetical protein BSLG_007976 [Batrachochytrium salamandrivorans]|nr:hypothetical protein BASA83_001206 [Batrachochytrium salamandrivorans]KAJ1334821.1 hypothetical protein BSLG_007976 [Batrachochytrium salamandrivorans]